VTGAPSLGGPPVLVRYEKRASKTTMDAVSALCGHVVLCLTLPMQAFRQTLSAYAEVCGRSSVAIGTRGHNQATCRFSGEWNLMREGWLDTSYEFSRFRRFI
jgi:hypothetical protein